MVRFALTAALRTNADGKYRYKLWAGGANNQVLDKSQNLRLHCLHRRMQQPAFAKNLLHCLSLELIFFGFTGRRRMFLLSHLRNIYQDMAVSNRPE